MHFFWNCLYSFPEFLDGSAKALMIIFVAWMHFVNFQTKLKESHEIRLGTNMLRNYDKPVYYKTSQNGQKGKSKINKFLFVWYVGPIDLSRAELKGQLISKCLFGVFNFFQKMNEQIRLYYDTSGRLVFVRFLEEIEDTKKTFRN